MTTKEIHNLNIDNEDTDIIKYCACLGSVTNSNGDCIQETKRKLRLKRTAMEELGRSS